jgi:carbamoylphosphate synthase large subunit
MAVSTVPEYELDQALEVMSESETDVIYLVDSFGSFYSEQIDYLMRKYLKYADDKVESKKLFSDLNIPYPETYQIIQWMGDIESKWAEISEKDSFVIKPARGRAGNGIVVLKKDKSYWITPSAEEYTEEMIKKLEYIAEIQLNKVSDAHEDDDIYVVDCAHSLRFVLLC